MVLVVSGGHVVGSVEILVTVWADVVVVEEQQPPWPRVVELGAGLT